jgi:tRNA dimethylallyltransferase
MQKLVIVCGPTAVGKTNTALTFASAYNGSIISVDSRQMYAGLDIGSGKDIPDDFILKPSSCGIPSYSKSTVDIFGYDVFTPTTIQSPSQLAKKLLPAIEMLERHHKLPILVSGSGNYLRAIVSPPETAAIPPNPLLRTQLASKNISELQAMLQTIAHSRLLAMNASDRCNPRRLVRAIEIALFRRNSADIKPESKQFDVLWIGLTASMKLIEKRIKQRVAKRLRNGVIEETQTLLQTYPKCASLLQVTLGYQQVLAFLSGSISRNELKELWALKEYQYAKRQLTWFKKNDRIHWFDIQDPGIDTAIINLLQSWN